MLKNIYDFSLNSINGQPTSLSKFKGQVLLMVNVASKCGLTPQYSGLTEIYKKYQPKGFEILAFPANEFLAQEPGSNSEIQEFCTLNYGVSFPLFEKIVVKGENQHPLYSFLTTTKPLALKNPGSTLEHELMTYGQKRNMPEDILWNFEKFLVAKNGTVLERFAPDIEPNDPLLVKAIEQALV
jgi:glutathione peroxidase